MLFVFFYRCNIQSFTSMWKNELHVKNKDKYVLKLCLQIVVRPLKPVILDILYTTIKQIPPDRKSVV